MAQAPAQNGAPPPMLLSVAEARAAAAGAASRREEASQLTTRAYKERLARERAGAGAVGGSSGRPPTTHALVRVRASMLASAREYVCAVPCRAVPCCACVLRVRDCGSARPARMVFRLTIPRPRAPGPRSAPRSAEGPGLNRWAAVNG